MKKMNFKIYKWNPYVIKKPFYLNYDFNFSLERKMKMVLDSIIYATNKCSFNLSFRKSCREGICGSCSMNINGLNKLACLTVSGQTNVINPLPHLPLRKDLIVDFKWFYFQLFKIKPWIFSKSYLNRWVFGESFKKSLGYQGILDRRKLDGLYECILCACCSTSCPSYWWNKKVYLGPAVLLQSYRWLIDSRDFFFSSRINNLLDPFKMYRCHMILNCSQTCPKDLKPSVAIASLKNYVSQYVLI